MSTADSQELLKQEAKAIRLRIDGLIKDENSKVRMIRAAAIYGGMLTETLIDYDEPDVVMEQAFHRMADLLQTNPTDADVASFLPDACAIDHDTELGRQMAQIMAEKLPKGLDDVHEIAIALVINDFPMWKEEGIGKDILLRVLVEMVVSALSFEMAAQDFCDFVIEDLVTEGMGPGEALLGLSAVAGHYLVLAEMQKGQPENIDMALTNVMVRESIHHGTPGTKDWSALAASNDVEDEKLRFYMEKIKPTTDEFFEMIGVNDPLSRAVAVAKAAGRMVAVLAVEDIGQIHPSIAKSLAKTGMILGTRYRAGIAQV